MCMFSQPKAPPPVVVPDAPKAIEQPAPTPQGSDESVQQARSDDRARRLRAANANDTLVTGGAGVTTPAQTGLKSAFGQ